MKKGEAVIICDKILLYTTTTTTNKQQHIKKECIQNISTNTHNNWDTQIVAHTELGLSLKRLRKRKLQQGLTTYTFKHIQQQQHTQKLSMYMQKTHYLIWVQQRKKKRKRNSISAQYCRATRCTQISSVVREQMIASLPQHTAMIYCESHFTINCQWPQASLHVLPIRRHIEHAQINVYIGWNNLGSCW